MQRAVQIHVEPPQVRIFALVSSDMSVPTTVQHMVAKDLLRRPVMTPSTDRCEGSGRRQQPLSSGFVAVDRQSLVVDLVHVGARSAEKAQHADRSAPGEEKCR
jgi:hypothetical protein